MAGAAGGLVNIVAGCRMRFVMTDMSSGIPPAASGIFSCSIAGGFCPSRKTARQGNKRCGGSFVAFFCPLRKIAGKMSINSVWRPLNSELPELCPPIADTGPKGYGLGFQPQRLSPATLCHLRAKFSQIFSSVVTYKHIAR